MKRFFWLIRSFARHTVVINAGSEEYMTEKSYADRQCEKVRKEMREIIPAHMKAIKELLMAKR